MSQAQQPATQRKNLFAKARTEEASGAGKNKMENFPIEVVAYEGDSVKGVRLDNNEEVTVVLRDLPEKDVASKFSRPDVASFAAKRSKNATEVGGTLMVEGAFKQENGTFSARWLKVLSHFAGEAYTIPSSLVNLSVRSRADGKQFGVVDIIPTKKWIDSDYEAVGMQPPTLINDRKQLISVMRDTLASTGRLGVRIAALEDGVESLDAICVFAKTSADKKSYEVDEAIERFEKSYDAEQLDALFAGGRVEVIPMRSVFVGPMAFEAMEKEKAAGPNNGAINHFAGDEKDVIYAEAVVTLRAREDKSQYVTAVTKIGPIQATNVGDALAFVATENIEPNQAAAFVASGDTVDYTGGEPGEPGDQSAPAAQQEAASEARPAVRRRNV